MAPDPPPLPTKFPCWCRAIYSWGGETKRDLGFVEGDLIECLNAGDGSWWMGRLRRDRRMMGLFPSNFVTVLGDDFVPGNNRSVTPMGGGDALSRTDSSTPKKQKTVYRKPFQAHKEAITPAEAARRANSSSEALSPSPSRENTPPRQSQALRTRTPTTAVRHRRSLARPPSRPGSPPASHEPEVSPARHRRSSISRPQSHELPPHPPQDRDESPPPPPPPPHRVAVNSQTPRKRLPPPPLEMNDRYAVISRTPSPVSPSQSPGPPSPAVTPHTPSPLRDAMEDVMSSLQDMGLSHGPPSPSPPPSFSNPWSPDAYDSIRAASPRPPSSRPLTSLGFGGDGGGYEGEEDDNHPNFPDRYHDGPPQFNNYVQRMERRLRQLHEQNGEDPDQLPDDDVGPPPPPRRTEYRARHNSCPRPTGVQSTTTTETSSTGKTLMSGTSAGGISATSAGSFARRAKWGSFSAERPNTAMSVFNDPDKRPQTPLSGISYHSSHNTSRQGAMSAIPWSSEKEATESPGVFGGLATPKVKKNGFFKRFLESAKTGAANARSSIAVGQSGGSTSPTKGRLSLAVSSRKHDKDSARDTGPGGGGSVDWVQVRRDVNRASTPSRNERIERAERCQMMDHPVIYAVEELYETAEGDEGIDGLPLSEPTNFAAVNLSMVDKNARFINSLPPLTNPASLAQGYVCRPYKSDVQRLRAIFTWVSEKIAWDEPMDEDDVDMKRVISMRRGSPREVAILVKEMCAAVGLHADVIRGYLKTPGEVFDLDSLSRPNHWWNAVLVDGEWRIMDCSLASSTNPRRSLLVTTNSQHAETWYFLARPMEICYTHIPLHPEEQHICPPISPEVLLALPPASPAFFKNGLQIPDYDTSFVRIEGLEVMQLRIFVPPDVECAAEVEAPAFARDADGDLFESGEVVRKRALAQPDWIRGRKRFTVKAVLPGDEGQGVLKIYAGKKGLMHSSKDIPHPLALALPIIHTGENPPYDFLIRHPTPHAQRHDLYVMQPQCWRLAINNTFVFTVRQHPAYPPPTSFDGSSGGRASPVHIRPSSALSMVSSGYGDSNASTTSVNDGFSASTSAVSSGKSSGREKPAKLAIQSPSGKILRLMRKADHMISTSSNTDSGIDGTPDGSVWETVIKIGERGVWRGLVLADRVARWCVFCEWECF
ncbi:SH3 domain protein (Cyk3) [Rasamsonia emersonii CBS 393.64]|uniref:SH3 domain protein (Cyk3) n=1 Tax=Rasamsonia emersonii (strain ATCC 16479 / CBS 393.64 / IMI 116815) TaxID=1408163 RepID=A0A0F4YNF0_RASE3|nr:SH3 domain protein (Cyk3) [Rasamsonia emersonii CBS 393.64]KKA19620.1 SH3 domain protein (Cyk3) [Rasamsonia emersonii CBS 393.64]